MDSSGLYLKTGYQLNPGHDPGQYHISGGGLPAMKSYGDTFCAIGTGKINTEAATYTGTGNVPYSGFPENVIRYPNLSNAVSPPPPIPNASGIIVAANYLDPLADPISNPLFMSGARATGSLGTGTGGLPLYSYASGHDIESVARGDLSGLGRLAQRNVFLVSQ